tara:strand:+ start:46768 stop:47508 length:741 start_codon:yes stop_codon:yes gene_type:complete
MRFSILTYNIHKGFSQGSEFTLHDMRDALKQQSPDILFLQEVQGEHKAKQDNIAQWPLESQLEFLSDSHWQHQIYAKNAVYKQGHHGNGIASKHEIQRWENINVAMNKAASRSLLHAEIQLPDSDQKLHVICAHLGLFEAEREKQIAMLSERIESHVPHDEPLIIAGDFNDWRKRVGQYLQEHLELKEVFLEQQGKHAKTFPAVLPALSVDRIYYRGLDLIKGERLTGKPWTGLSDHIPLLAEFEI